MINWSKFRTFRTRKRRVCRSVGLQFAYRQARGVTFTHPTGFVYHYTLGSAPTSTITDSSCQFTSDSEGVRAGQRGHGILLSAYQLPCMSYL